MKTLIEEKIKLDNAIKKLIEEFAINNNCGYKGNVEVTPIKETKSGCSYVVGLHKNINTVITT